MWLIWIILRFLVKGKPFSASTSTPCQSLPGPRHINSDFLSMDCWRRFAKVLVTTLVVPFGKFINPDGHVYGQLFLSQCPGKVPRDPPAESGGAGGATWADHEDESDGDDEQGRSRWRTMMENAKWVESQLIQCHNANGCSFSTQL